jgi:hypothetical protein
MTDWSMDGWDIYFDGDDLVAVVDPTGEDCGCVITTRPDGTWEDSGCFRHCPHHSGEGETA